jgi:hypothetical protein
MLQVLEDAVGVLEQELAGVAEDDAPSDAREELAAEVGFELFNVLADGGLGEVEQLSSAGETTHFGGGAEDAELLKIHRYGRLIVRFSHFARRIAAM